MLCLFGAIYLKVSSGILRYLHLSRKSGYQEEFTSYFLFQNNGNSRILLGPCVRQEKFHPRISDNGVSVSSPRFLPLCTVYAGLLACASSFFTSFAAFSFALAALDALIFGFSLYIFALISLDATPFFVKT